MESRADTSPPAASRANPVSESTSGDDKARHRAFQSQRVPGHLRELRTRPERLSHREEALSPTVPPSSPALSRAPHELGPPAEQEVVARAGNELRTQRQQPAHRLLLQDHPAPPGLDRSSDPGCRRHRLAGGADPRDAPRPARAASAGESAPATARGSSSPSRRRGDCSGSPSGCSGSSTGSSRPNHRCRSA